MLQNPRTFVESMGQIATYSCKGTKSTFQPVSPAHNDSWLLDSSGLIGVDWVGHESEIVTWHSLLGWLYFGPPQKGTRAWDEPREQWLIFDGTIWRKSSQFSVDGSGDQTLTGSYAKLTNWGTPTKEDGSDSYGCFDFASGVLELIRDQGQINLRAAVTVEQTASGNQNDFAVVFEKSTDGGTIWTSLGPITGGNTFSNAAMIRDEGVPIYEDHSAASGDKYRVAVKQTAGSGTLKAMGSGLHWHAEEVY